MENKKIPLTERHLQLLEKRGISGETAARLGWQTLENHSGDWISIPYLRKGRTVNNKYRTIAGDKRFSQDKGGEQCLYNLQALEDIERLSGEDQRGTTLVITEGEMDCAIALQCGYLAVSVPNGAPEKIIESETTTKFDYLNDLPKFCLVVLAVDDDSAGRVLRQELALRVGWHRCKWVKYPISKREQRPLKDLNEVFMEYGEKGVRKTLNEQAHFMNVSGLMRMSEIPAQPELPAYECGIGNVSDMIKLRGGDFIVVTGIPSMGKSIFVNGMACNMVRDYGWNVCFGSFEQSPRTDHLRFLRTFYLDKARLSASGYPQWEDAEIAEADAWIDKHFGFIVPDLNSDELITLKWVLARVRAAITQQGARLVVIDPWNELDHDRPQGMSLTEYTGYAIKEFKRLAKQYMVTVIVVAHPAKMEKAKDGTYGVPTLYDISDSSHWYNKCDLGVIIHRMEGEKPNDYATLVRVSKVRYWGVIGKLGDRFLEYLPARAKYLDYTDFQPKRKKPANEITKKEKAKDADEPPAQGALPYKEN